MSTPLKQQCIYKVEVARSIDEIERFRVTWKHLNWHPNADIDFYLSRITSRPNVLRPHVIRISEQGRPTTLLVGRVEDINLPIRLGYWNVLKVHVRSLTVIYGGWMGNLSNNNCTLLVCELLNSLRAKEADLVSFNMIPLDSALSRVALKLPFFLSVSRPLMPKAHWETQLPNEYSQFLEKLSRNSRYNIRRYSKQFLKKYGDRISVRAYHSRANLLETLRELAAMEKLTYKYPIGAALLDNEETRRTLLHELTQGWLRLYVLCIDGAAKAYWKLAVYGRTAFSESLSYDPSFERDRIGHVCQQITLQALCNEHRVDKVDFGFGDAQYKRSLGDVVWHEATIQIFHRSVRGLVLNLLLSSCKLLERSLRYLGERFRITSRLKSKWRTFLRKEDS